MEVNIISETAEVPTSCDCRGESQEGDCTLEKKGILGYVAYYCSGCKTCIMN